VLASDGADPSLVYDYDDASVAVAHYDCVAGDIVVIDGWWVD